jgi:hypothetical protein
MNGRHINSWGVNPIIKPRGLMMRALFETDSSWDFKDKGNTIRHVGIESRSLCFAPNHERQSAADDGGLIELQVFRARGKRRRPPRPEAFRPQDSYGLT